MSVSQAELRAMMRRTAGAKGITINHPLARTDAGTGVTTCKLCTARLGVITSLDIWQAHLMSKDHIHALEAAKAKLQASQSRPAPSAQGNTVVIAATTAATTTANTATPSRKIASLSNPTPLPAKSVATSSVGASKGVPADFFDAPQRQTAETTAPAAAKTDYNSVTLASASRKSHVSALEKAKAEAVKSSSIPLGFYDDPLADAKAHRIDPKSVVAAAREEEWEEFMSFARGVGEEERGAAGAEEERYTQDRAMAAAAEDVVYHARLDIVKHLRDMKRTDPHAHVIAQDEDDDDIGGQEGAELVQGISFLTAANARASGVSTKEVANILKNKIEATKRTRADNDTASDANRSKRMRGDETSAATVGDEDDDTDLDALLDWRNKTV